MIIIQKGTQKLAPFLEPIHKSVLRKRSAGWSKIGSAACPCSASTIFLTSVFGYFLGECKKYLAEGNHGITDHIFGERLPMISTYLPIKQRNSIVKEATSLNLCTLLNKYLEITKNTFYVLEKNKRSCSF